MSPPTSRVRSVARRPPSAAAIAAYSVSCSSTTAAPRGRGRGTRSGRARPRRRRRRRPARASTTEPRLAATTIRVPSRVTAGSLADARGRGHDARPGRRPGPVARRPPPASGSTCDLAGGAVHDDRRALGHREHVAPGRHHERDAAGPGQDRGVRGRAPGRRARSPSPARCRGRRPRAGVRSRGDQDPSATAWWLPHPREHASYLVTHGADVGGTLAQVGVGQLGPLAARCRTGTRSRRRRRRARSRSAAGRRRASRSRRAASGGRRRSRPRSPPTSRTVRARRCSMSRRTSATRLGDPAPLGRRVAGPGSSCDRPGGAVSRRTGPIAMPGERRDRPGRQAARLRRRRRHAVSSKFRAASATRCSTASWAWRTGGADLDLVPALGTQRGDPAQLAGRHRARAGGQVGER